MYYILWQNRHVFEFKSIGQTLFCFGFLILTFGLIIGAGFILDKIFKD